MQLNIMYSVTFDTARKSLTAKVLCHPWLHFLGKISYTLFLTHALVVGYYLLATQHEPKPGCAPTSAPCTPGRVAIGVEASVLYEGDIFVFPSC